MRKKKKQNYNFSMSWFYNFETEQDYYKCKKKDSCLLASRMQRPAVGRSIYSSHPSPDLRGLAPHRKESWADQLTGQIPSPHHARRVSACENSEK